MLQISVNVSRRFQTLSTFHIVLCVPADIVALGSVTLSMPGKQFRALHTSNTHKLETKTKKLKNIKIKKKITLLYYLEP